MNHAHREVLVAEIDNLAVLIHDPLGLFSVAALDVRHHAENRRAIASTT